MTEEDDRYEDDEVEPNDLEIEEVALEDDWTHSRYDYIILYINLVYFLHKRYYKIQFFVVFLNDECDFMNFWN